MEADTQREGPKSTSKVIEKQFDLGEKTQVKTIAKEMA
jgi:hypothetical protein